MDGLAREIEDARGEKWRESEEANEPAPLFPLTVILLHIVCESSQSCRRAWSEEQAGYTACGRAHPFAFEKTRRFDSTAFAVSSLACMVAS